MAILLALELVNPPKSNSVWASLILSTVGLLLLCLLAIGVATRFRRSSTEIAVLVMVTLMIGSSVVIRWGRIFGLIA